MNREMRERIKLCKRKLRGRGRKDQSQLLVSCHGGRKLSYTGRIPLTQQNSPPCAALLRPCLQCLGYLDLICSNTDLIQNQVKTGLCERKKVNHKKKVSFFGTDYL